MKIEVHLLCWNEIDIMPFVIKHYQSFCDRIIIHDNNSSDDGRIVARAMECQVITFGDNTFNDQHNMDVKNTCWIGSDADWVIVADFDELLWMAANDAATVRRYLQSAMEAGHTFISTTGWQIMNEDMPMDKLTEISTGYYFGNYSKNIIFNPKKILSTNYGPGAHEWKPTGYLQSPEQSPLFVMHYKHIGGVERTIKRYRDYMKRMSKTNLKNGWGIHYKQNERQLRREWKERMEKSVKLF